MISDEEGFSSFPAGEDPYHITASNPYWTDLWESRSSFLFFLEGHIQTQTRSQLLAPQPGENGTQIVVNEPTL